MRKYISGAISFHYGMPYAKGVPNRHPFLQQLYGRAASALPGIVDLIPLRWQTSPDVGFPISPFKIYRRKRGYVKAKDIKGSAKQNIYLSEDFSIVSGAITNLTNAVKQTAVQFRNRAEEIIATESLMLAPRQTQYFTKSAVGISSVHTADYQTVLQLKSGIEMSDTVNSDGWELIEIVGLPVTTSNQIPNYDGGKQGKVSNLKSGADAGIDRLGLFETFYNAPMFKPPAGWKIPKPKDLIYSYHQTTTIKNGVTGVLHDLGEMFSALASNPMLYNGLQSNYEKHYQTDGMSDNGQASSDDAIISDNILSTYLCALSSDAWDALGLGFGTNLVTDSNREWEKTGYNLHYEYMISAVFLMPETELVLSNDIINPVKKKFIEYKEAELATLLRFKDLSVSHTAVNANKLNDNRPLKIDTPYSEETKLSWLRQQKEELWSYYIAYKDQWNYQLLNTPRAFLDVPKPFLPFEKILDEDSPTPDPLWDKVTEFIHHRSQRDDRNPLTKTYYLAATNLYGEWSEVSEVNHNVSPAPRHNADLLSAVFTLDASGPVTAIPARLEIKLSWKWHDRSPAMIEIASKFLPPSAISSVTNSSNIGATAGVALSNVSATTQPYAIGFTNGDPVLLKKLGGSLVTAPGSEGKVEIDNSQVTDSQLITYKVTLNNIVLDFSAAEKLYCAVYCRSSVALTPDLVSDWGYPSNLLKIVSADNPKPKATPAINQALVWASLPDALNHSFYHLSFPMVPGATGYVVYNTTEAAIRAKLNQQFQGSDMQLRANNLRGLIDSNKEQLKDCFLRLQREPLLKPEVDLKLPGDGENIFLYAFTSISPNNIESEMSDCLFLGIPRVNRPARPALTSFQRPHESKATIKVEFGPGSTTEKIELYSTHRDWLTTEIGLMGPGKVFDLNANLPGIILFDGDGTPLAASALKKAPAYALIETDLLPSWNKRFFKARATGRHNPGLGAIGGNSEDSNVTDVLPPPPAVPPLLSLLYKKDVGSFIELTFQTDAQFLTTHYGDFRLVVSKVNGAILTSSTELSLNKIQKEGTSIPLTDGLITRTTGQPGAPKLIKYYLAPAAATYQFTLIDPLGNSANISFESTGSRNFIKDLKAGIRGNSLIFEFLSNISSRTPNLHQYKCDIFLQDKNPFSRPLRLLSTSMDQIPERIHLRAKEYFYRTEDAGAKAVKYQGAKNLVLTPRNIITLMVIITTPTGEELRVSAIISQ